MNRVFIPTTLATFLIALLGCSSKKTPLCVTPFSSVLLTESEKMIDGVENSRPGSELVTIVESKSCRKELYRRGKYQIAIFMDRHDRPVSKFVEYEKRKANSLKCLERSVSFLNSDAPSYSKLILDRAKEVYGESWSDPIQGPLLWLTCAPKFDPIDWGLSTLMHELMHTLRTGKCLILPGEAGNTCIDAGGDLPAVQLTLQEIDTNDDDLNSMIREYRELYFAKRNKNGPFKFFDEIVGYSVGADMHVHFSKNYQTPVQRSLNLPFLLGDSAAYVRVLKSKHPKAYDAFYGKNSKNREAINKIWAIGEQSYLKWRAAIGSRPERWEGFRLVEEAFYQLYLDARKGLD